MTQAAPLSTVESTVLDCAYALALASSGPLDSPQAKELAAVAAEMLIRAAYQLPTPEPGSYTYQAGLQVLREALQAKKSADRRSAS